MGGSSSFAGQAHLRSADACRAAGRSAECHALGQCIGGTFWILVTWPATLGMYLEVDDWILFKGMILLDTAFFNGGKGSGISIER